MREIAVAIQNDNENVSVLDTINSIKNAGFKNVFIQWYDKDWEINQQEQLKLCKEAEFNIIFAHLGYQGINSIWEEGDKGEELVERYKRNLDECKENGISMVIMHLISRTDKPTYGELGLNRIKKIVEHAKKLNIKIAFENTRRRDYLEYVLKNIVDDNVGICFDSGHYHTFSDDKFDFELFKNRIFAVHLHDNDKTGDLHLLPFDGTVDWGNIALKLKECNFKGPITLELCYRYDYLNLPLDEFYKKGYEIGIRLAKMFDEVEAKI